MVTLGWNTILYYVWDTFMRPLDEFDTRLPMHRHPHYIPYVISSGMVCGRMQAALVMCSKTTLWVV